MAVADLPAGSRVEAELVEVAAVAAEVAVAKVAELAAVDEAREVEHRGVEAMVGALAVEAIGV